MKIPVQIPNINSVINALLEKGLLNTKIEITDTNGRYLHWDELRFKQPPPVGFTSEQWWAGMKHARRQMYKNINISDPKGKPFVFLYTDKIMETLHMLCYF